MISRSVFVRILAAAAFAAVLCCQPLRAADKEVKLKLATVAPKGTSYHQALVKMKDKWKDAPGGGVKAVVYPDGQMGGESDMVRRMRVGQIHAALMTASGLAEIDESITALQNMPMMFNDFDEVEYVRAALRSMIEAKFAEKGFVILALEDTGWVNFFSSKPAATPADFKNLKLFALSSDTKAVQIWKSAGFNPVPLDTTAMITGLRTGMVDAVPCPPYFALATQAYKSAPNMLDLNWAPLVGGIVIRKATWDELPEETRKAMREAAVEAGKEIREAGRKNNVESVGTMTKQGLNVVKPTAAQLEEWRTEVAKAYPIIRGSIVPADLFDQVKTLLDEYRAKHAAAGTEKTASNKKGAE